MKKNLCATMFSVSSMALNFDDTPDNHSEKSSTDRRTIHPLDADLMYRCPSTVSPVQTAQLTQHGRCCNVSNARSPEYRRNKAHKLKRAQPRQVSTVLGSAANLGVWVAHVSAHTAKHSGNQQRARFHLQTGGKAWRFFFSFSSEVQL